jgi:hypothetical protein
MSDGPEHIITYKDAYIRNDIHETAKAAARAEGRREGLLEAAAYHDAEKAAWERRSDKSWNSNVIRQADSAAQFHQDAAEHLRAAAEVSP